MSEGTDKDGKKLKEFDFKLENKVYEINQQEDREMLALIKKLGLRDGQDVTVNELLTIIKAIYPNVEPYLQVSRILGCSYIKTTYTVNLKERK